MRKEVLAAVVIGCLVAFSTVAGEQGGATKAIDGVLSSFHQAASDADGDLYFSLFTEDAIFMGTDATERWTVAEFKAFAEPYFSEGRGWTYTTTERHVYVAADGETAWFDEMLWNEKYGTCRGTGVLVRSPEGWRIAQYNLTFPIPNDLSAEITARINEFEKE
jgi:ketosteroid isomerase-like protein